MEIRDISLNDIDLQRQYYQDTSAQYDNMHITRNDEHFFALSFMVGMLDFLNVKSILDIGAGTGRAIQYIKQQRPEISIIGIEPSLELREIGYNKGIKRTELIDGNGSSIEFENKSFDMVCEFGVLHHVRQPDVVVSEMLRVADKAIFISDTNIYGDSRLLSRISKQVIKALGLWKIAFYLRTKGKGYLQTEEDGISYYYSVFDSFKQIKADCSSTHFINTNIWTGGNINLYRSASHIGLLGIKTLNKQK